MSVEALLPGNSTAFERATAAGMSDELPVPIRMALDPVDSPEAFVPFLGFQEGVKLWFDDWSLARKRSMVAGANQLADLIGTRPGLAGFLAYVDAQLISAVAHPRRFVAGRSAVGIQPLQFPSYTARYLIKVGLRRHKASYVFGRGALGHHALVSVNREPIRRAKIAATVSKGPATQYTATFAHRRRPTFDEMEFGLPFDAFIDRTSL